MALASEGFRTPFITSTRSNAVMLASTAVGGVTLKLGLGVGTGLGFPLFAAGPVSALLAPAAFSFAVFESLLRAITGRAVMASTRKLDNHLFTSNMDGLLMEHTAMLRGMARRTVRDCNSFLRI